MKAKGVVFDFNGTILWDTALHNRAWDRFLENHHLELSDGEKNAIIHGRNNEIIFPDLFGRKLTQAEIRRFVHEKEAIYRALFVEDPLDYAPGFVEFIDFLRSVGCQVAIATASGPENVDFYKSFLKLDDLVPERNIVFNDGTIRSKPDPQIFQMAIACLGVRSSEVVIFEDSLVGIRAAEKVGAGKIIIVNSTGADYRSFPHEVIAGFDQVDRSLF